MSSNNLSLPRERWDEKPPLNLQDLLGIARRRWLYFVVPAVLVLSVSVVVILNLPLTYRSTGTIFVESQKIPQDIVRSMVTGFAEERIQVIKQFVMTRENLVNILNKFNLFADRDESISKKVDLLRDSIFIETADAAFGGRGSASMAFEVSFEHREPAKAQGVANELVTLFLAENARTRTQRATETTEFLSEELEKLRTAMESIEQRIAAYKQENLDKLPENLGLNEAKLDRARARLRSVEGDQAAAAAQRDFYQVQLTAIASGAEQSVGHGNSNVLTPAERLMEVQNELVSKEAELLPDHPDIMKLRRQIAAFQSQIISSGGRTDVELALAQGRQGLERLRNLYTDKHPEVRSQLLLIDGLERRLATLPVAKRQVASSSAERELIARIRAVAAQIKNFEQEKMELRQQISLLEDRIEQTPQVERAILGLQRDYDNAASKYQEVKSKQLEAQLSQRLEEDQKAERFSLLEPPLLPEQHIKPKRRNLLLIALFLSGATGMGLVFVLEWADKSMRNPQQIARVLGEPPIVVLPYIETAQDIHRRAVAKRYLIGSAAGALVLLLVSVHYFYKPLDVLTVTLVDKIRLG